MSTFFLRRIMFAVALTATIIFAAIYLTHTPALLPAVDAADHGDSPIASLDRSADLADVYSFLDPNDNTRVILAVTVNGFIVPGEAVNFAVFDPGLLYRFNLEMTGDAIPDKSIDVRFSAKTASASQAQTATIKLPDGTTFTAPTTVPTLNATAPARVITTNPATGVQFFAGLVDDPFRFDIPGFVRFRDSVLAGNPNGDALKRGRDTFAGYNILAIAFSFPISMFQSAVNDEFGVEVVTLRTANSARLARSIRRFTKSATQQVDRCANPAVNVVLIPFSRKDEQNLSNTRDDAAGRFANSIIATLRSLGTSDANINTLANIAVVRGDFVRLNMSAPNSGAGGGNNGATGFPNGRRVGDDVVDTLLTVITNGFITTDNANANDVSFTDTFPFFGLSQQPRDTGIVEDNTRN